MGYAFGFTHPTDFAGLDGVTFYFSACTGTRASGSGICAR